MDPISETGYERDILLLLHMESDQNWALKWSPITYFHAIQISTVAVGIISLYTFPIMTSFLEPLFDREMVQFGNIIRAAIVFAGILLIVPKFELSNQTTAGVLWGLVSAALFSVRNITVRKKLGHLSSITVMCYQLA